MIYKDFVLVIDKNNIPCMPIAEEKARYLIKNNKAKIINHDPFVIQRIDNYDSEKENRPVILLKMDLGYSHIGFSVSSVENEFLAGDVSMLEGIKKRLANRKNFRRFRRQRKRYRKNKNANYKTVHNPTYKNGNGKGWYAPSIWHRVETHKRLADRLYSWIPINGTIVEISSFDIQKIKAEAEGKTISGIDYQMGEMHGFEDVKQYVRERDEYKCQICGEKLIGGKRGEVHHIRPRSWGGTDKPDNLITLCSSCHQKVHANRNDNPLFKQLQNKKITDTYKGAAFMNTARWKIYDILNEKYDVSVSYGTITKRNRIEAGLPKFHHNDAVCIHEFTNPTLTKNIYLIEQKRCNDRTMQNFSDAKYIDSRDGNKKTGSELAYTRKSSTTSKRSTRSEDVENNRIYREKKIKKGCFKNETHYYCVKPGDLIKIKVKKRAGVIAEVTRCGKTISGSTQICYKYDNQIEKIPSITIKPDEYNQLKETGECKSLKIVRTRRGMIWRKTDRLKYEEKYIDQYHVEK